MTEPRPIYVRVVVAAAALVLAVGLPIVIVLLAVVDERWRGLVSALAVGFIVVPVVIWFVGKKRPLEDEPPES